MLRSSTACLLALALTACSGGFESTGLADAGEETDAGTRTDTALPPALDVDGDGLDDAWEIAAGDVSRLDPAKLDSDGNGVADGAEDYDGDRLINSVEYALSRLPVASGVSPSPFRRDLLVELDEMSGRAVADSVLAETAAAYAALPDPIGLLIFRDESAIEAFDFDGSFEQRHEFFAAHGPAFDPSVLPTSEMIHVAVVTRRTDQEFRGGEVVTHGEGDVERSGVLIFYDALADLHPQCGEDGGPPDITLDEALASALAHELGHTLQLGHDTEAGGGINYFNIMSVPTTCNEAHQRFHGIGNTDGTLGATDGVGSRFSAEASALIRFDQRLSVDTAELVNEGVGQPM
jgi:hypothetical protein